MVNFYARKCEKDGFNFYDVPKTWQSKVKDKIEKDGYAINADGSVSVKNG